MARLTVKMNKQTVVCIEQLAGEKEVLVGSVVGEILENILDLPAEVLDELIHTCVGIISSPAQDNTERKSRRKCAAFLETLSRIRDLKDEEGVIL